MASWGTPYNGKERTKPRRLLDLRPITDKQKEELILEIAKSKAKVEMDNERQKFLEQRWTTPTRAVLATCAEMELIDIKRELLRKCYSQIPELTDFLSYDYVTKGYRRSGEFRCTLDGRELCRMDCVCETGERTVSVQVQWTIGSETRSEKWSISFLSLGKKKIIVNDYKERRIIAFDMINRPDAVRAKTFYGPNVGTLVSMRALLDTLTA